MNYSEVQKCLELIFCKAESFSRTMYNIYWYSRVVATELKVERNGSHRKLPWSENLDMLCWIPETWRF